MSTRVKRVPFKDAVRHNTTGSDIERHTAFRAAGTAAGTVRSQEALVIDMLMPDWDGIQYSGIL
jgi:hypothetical protein